MKISQKKQSNMHILDEGKPANPANSAVGYRDGKNRSKVRATGSK